MTTATAAAAAAESMAAAAAAAREGCEAAPLRPSRTPATRVPLAAVNSHLICVLCGGYLIDAVAVVECLHTFCRSCLLKYLEVNKLCPICDVQVHKSKPLVNIRVDSVLQSLIYKLVPNLYANEMQKRKKFYEEHPEIDTSLMEPEAIGEINEEKAIAYTRGERVAVTLRYGSSSSKSRGEEACKDKKSALTINLNCPLDMAVAHLKQFLLKKYGIWQQPYEICVSSEQGELEDSVTLWDAVALNRRLSAHRSPLPASARWQQTDVVELCYTIGRKLKCIVRKRKPHPNPPQPPELQAPKQRKSATARPSKRKSRRSQKRDRKRKHLVKDDGQLLPPLDQEGDHPREQPPTGPPPLPPTPEEPAGESSGGGDIPETIPAAPVQDDDDDAAAPSCGQYSPDIVSDTAAPRLPEEEAVEEEGGGKQSEAEILALPEMTSPAEGDIPATMPSPCPEVSCAPSPPKVSEQSEALDLSRQGTGLADRLPPGRLPSRSGKGQSTQTILSIADTLASRQLTNQSRPQQLASKTLLPPSKRHQPPPPQPQQQQQPPPPSKKLLLPSKALGKISITKVAVGDREPAIAVPIQAAKPALGKIAAAMTLKIPKPPCNHFPSLWEKPWESWRVARHRDLALPQANQPFCRKLTSPAKPFIPRKPNPTVRNIPNPSLLRHPRFPSSSLLTGAASLRRDLESLVEDVTLQQAHAAAAAAAAAAFP